MIKKNIWVFGATGYIGRALIKVLQKNSDNRVIALTHKTLPGANFEEIICLQKSLTQLTKEDFEQFPPQQIYHLARFGAPLPFLRNYSATKGAKANTRLIDILKSLDKTPDINYVSGSLMYGATEKPTTEDSILNPMGFGKAYIKGEEPFLNNKLNELNIHFYRPGWILGPSSWFEAFFWKPYLLHGIVPYYGDGKQLMSIISLADCAGLIAHGSNHLKTNEDLNPAIFPTISQFDFAKKMSVKLGCDTKKINLSEMQKTMDYQTIEALTTSINLASKHRDIISSYIPKYQSIDEILTETIEQLKAKT
jgi:nucleoside-diphosphate-sugar epimerase